MGHGLIKPTPEGTPQGGNLPPLLANIYLTKSGNCPKAEAINS